MEAAKKARDFERHDTRAEAAKALAQLEENGMQVNQISAEETQRMRERAQPAIQQVVDTVGQPLFDQVQAELAKAAN
jgi:TRAP-type C4-dicarboxylate transport system substrate-binding protein